MILLILLMLLIILLFVALLSAMMYVIVIAAIIFSFLYILLYLFRQDKDRKYDKRKLMVLALIFSSFLFIILISLEYSQDKKENNTNLEKNYSALSENCDKIINEQKKNLCYKDLAEKSGMTEFCSKINFIESEDYGDNKNYCFRNVAINTLNKTICNFIDLYDDRLYPEVMKDECYSEIAKKKKDPNICLSITTNYRDWERKDCIWTIATNLRDPLICEIWISGGLRGTQECKDDIYDSLSK